MVLALRDWVTWHAFVKRDSRKSSSARAHTRVKDAPRASLKETLLHANVAVLNDNLNMDVCGGHDTLSKSHKRLSVRVVRGKADPLGFPSQESRRTEDVFLFAFFPFFCEMFHNIKCN